MALRIASVQSALPSATAPKSVIGNSRAGNFGGWMLRMRASRIWDDSEATLGAVWLNAVELVVRRLASRIRKYVSGNLLAADFDRPFIVVTSSNVYIEGLTHILSTSFQRNYLRLHVKPNFGPSTNILPAITPLCMIPR